MLYLHVRGIKNSYVCLRFDFWYTNVRVWPSDFGNGLSKFYTISFCYIRKKNQILILFYLVSYCV